MPISSQVPIIGYVANGVTKSFAFPFAILSADDLKVKVGADVVTTGFSIAGVGARNGGSVTFTNAPASPTPITLYRKVTLDRTTDYQENGDLLAVVLDDDLDRIWMALQDQLLLSDRALRAPIGETLQQLPPASERALMALAFDAAGNPIVVRGTNDGGAALALDLMDTAPGKGAALVGFQQEGAGAVARTAQSKMRDVVSVKDFGAVCDGVTDDAPSVQKAVDYCLTFDPPAILTVPGLCTLHTTVNIDRGNDASNASTYFIIKGDGIGGGFYAYYGVTMFSTTLTTGNPNSLAASQKIHFDNIVFKSEFPSNPTYVLDDAKFLRMKFTNCSFHRIKLLNATRYLQTYYLNNCMSYGWIGPFINGTNGAYDIKVDNHVAEAGTTFYSVVCNDVYSGDPNAQISITNSLFQSINSVCIEADRAQGFVVQNCYFEGNGADGADGSPDIKFDTARNLANQTPNTSITISGCYFSQLLANFNNPAYFSVRWGRTTQSGFAAGNHLVNLGTGAALKLHYRIPESRVTFMGEPGYVQGYFSQMVSSDGGYVMPGDGGERLRMVRGIVESSGVVSGGGGFSVNKTGPGQYQFDMLTAFNGLPSVVASAGGTTGQNLAAEIGVNSPSQFVINFRKVDHSYVDTKFFFTAIGPAL